MSNLEQHSPLGGSGAHRWMKCAGSVHVSKGVSDPESEYAALGTAAHALAELCLVHRHDAFLHLGKYYVPMVGIVGGGMPGGNICVDSDMVEAVQVYLDAVAEAYPDQNQGNTWIERSFHCKRIHPLMYGKADFVHLDEFGVFQGTPRCLHVWDYKHGVGVVVEADNNPQGMYYAIGMLEDLNLWELVDTVVIHIAQPRGFHWKGPIREWTISVADLVTWADEVLLPAMDLAELVSRDTALSGSDMLRAGLLNSGEHCRFCPARWAACPKLVSDMEELRTMVKQTIPAAGGAPALTNEQLGEFLNLFEVAKIVQKAARTTGFQRASGGHTVPGWHLAKAKSNRVWKAGAEKQAVNDFSGDAMTTPQFKSPAQLEKLPLGKAFCTRWAEKPDAGMQLVPDTDPRPEVGPKARSMFKPANKETK